MGSPPLQLAHRSTAWRADGGGPAWEECTGPDMLQNRPRQHEEAGVAVPHHQGFLGENQETKEAGTTRERLDAWNGWVAKAKRSCGLCAGVTGKTTVLTGPARLTGQLGR